MDWTEKYFKEYLEHMELDRWLERRPGGQEEVVFGAYGDQETGVGTERVENFCQVAPEVGIRKRTGGEQRKLTDMFEKASKKTISGDKDDVDGVSPPLKTMVVNLFSKRQINFDLFLL